MSVFQVACDWLSFTLPAGDAQSTPDWVASCAAHYVNGGAGVPLPRGRYGYPSAVSILGTGVVLWNNERPEMGVHVELPSKALAVASMSLLELLGWMVDLGGTVTRLDVAMDTDAVTVGEVVAMEADGRLVSRSQNRRLVTDLKSGAQTLYVGAPQSKRMVRVYDKALESGYDYDCIRIEVQFRAEYAQQGAAYLLAGMRFGSLVFSAIDFRDGDDSNVTRRERSSWWAECVDGCERLSFALKSLMQTLESSYDWVCKQVAPTLAFLTLAFGGAEWLSQLVDFGTKNLKPHQLSILGHLAT